MHSHNCTSSSAELQHELPQSMPSVEGCIDACTSVILYQQTPVSITCLLAGVSGFPLKSGLVQGKLDDIPD